MKLLFSLTYYTPYVSGLTLYVKRLGEALVKKGYKVNVLTMNFDKKQHVRQIVSDVEVVRAGYLTKISKGFISLDWIMKSWQEVRKSDCIIVNLPQFEGIWPAFFGKILGRKVISIYHCEVDLPEGIINNLVERVLYISHFVTLALSDVVVTYTQDFGDSSKLLIRFRPKLEFIYPPILVPEADKGVQRILIDRIPHVRQFVIGVAARLAAEKGIEYLLEAIPLINESMKQFNNGQLKIIIAGSMEPVGEERYKRKIFELVEKYKDSVVFLGELKEEEMGSFYSLIDVLVLPSVNSTEAFGMVQVESMMMGVPVVATDLPGVRIPIQKTGMGKLVPIRNSQELASAITEVLSKKDRYRKSKEPITREFSFEKTIEFYKNLLAEI